MPSRRSRVGMIHGHADLACGDDGMARTIVQTVPGR